MGKTNVYLRPDSFLGGQKLGRLDVVRPDDSLPPRRVIRGRLAYFGSPLLGSTSAEARGKHVRSGRGRKGHELATGKL